MKKFLFGFEILYYEIIELELFFEMHMMKETLYLQKNIE
jgi:hypothetical protein